MTITQLTEQETLEELPQNAPIVEYVHVSSMMMSRVGLRN